jgi:hypothetical protein
VTFSWKIVKRLGLLLFGAYEVVVKLAISGVGEKLTIRKVSSSFMKLVWRRTSGYVAFLLPSW